MITQKHKIRNYHAFEYNNSCFIFDTYNYITIQVSKKFYDYFLHVFENKKISYQGDYKKEKKVLEELVKNNYFVSERSFDVQEVSTEKIAFLSLAPIYECNFRCKYCFAGDRERYKFYKEKFTYESTQEVLEWFTKEAFPDMENYRVDFVSGGEPLLNFEVIEAVVDYGKKIKKIYGKNMFIWLCTNGSLLNEKICNYLNVNNISIGVSIDGYRDIHNLNRVDIAGNGTYDIVIQNIDRIVQNTKYTKKFRSIWGLSVMTANTNLLDAFKHHEKHNIKNVQFKFVRSEGTEINAYNNPQIIEQYKQFADYLLESVNEGIDSFLMILNDNDYFGKLLRRIILKEAYLFRCKAGKNKVTVCPNGDVYPCDSFVGNEKFLMGNIKDGKKNYYNRPFLSVLERPKCKECSVHFLCGGNCYYDSFLHTGDENLTGEEFCKIYKQLCNIALWVVFKLENEHLEQYRKILKIIDYKDRFTKE